MSAAYDANLQILLEIFTGIAEEKDQLAAAQRLNDEAPAYSRAVIHHAMAAVRDRRREQAVRRVRRDL